jgi:hypothetical protein
VGGIGRTFLISLSFYLGMKTDEHFEYGNRFHFHLQIVQQGNTEPAAASDESQHLPTATTTNTVRTDPRYEKYFKMLKMVADFLTAF